MVLGTTNSVNEGKADGRKVVIISGSALMAEGDPSLLIDIPSEHQAVASRILDIDWEVKLEEQSLVTGRAYSSGFSSGYK